LKLLPVRIWACVLGHNIIYLYLILLDYFTPFIFSKIVEQRGIVSRSSMKSI
jgi:hypothetical protein